MMRRLVAALCLLCAFPLLGCEEERGAANRANNSPVNNSPNSSINNSSNNAENNSVSNNSPANNAPANNNPVNNNPACTPSPEVCDGADNDCDGDTDEGCDCLDGEERSCVEGLCMGSSRCEAGRWSACLPDEAPTQERCDGEDEDCDGLIDEGCGCTAEDGPQPCLVGLCEGRQLCVGGLLGECTPVGPPGDEACNGEDDDCDGAVDEGVTRACGTSVGACEEGVERCVEGAWSRCEGDIPPQEETCEGLDLNCNGVLDDAAATGLASALLPSTLLQGDNRAAHWLDAETLAVGQVRDFTIYVRLLDVPTQALIAESPALSPRSQSTLEGLASAQGVLGALVSRHDSGTGTRTLVLALLDAQGSLLREVEIGAGGAGTLRAAGERFVVLRSTEVVWVRASSGVVEGRQDLGGYAGSVLEASEEGAWVVATSTQGTNERVSVHLSDPNASPVYAPGSLDPDASCVQSVVSLSGIAVVYVLREYVAEEGTYASRLMFQRRGPNGAPQGHPQEFARDLGAVPQPCHQLRVAERDGQVVVAWESAGGARRLALLSAQGELLAAADDAWAEGASPVALRMTSDAALEQLLYHAGRSSYELASGRPFACGVASWELLTPGSQCGAETALRCPLGSLCEPRRGWCVEAAPPRWLEAAITSRPASQQVVIDAFGEFTSDVVVVQMTPLDAAGQALSMPQRKVLTNALNRELIAHDLERFYLVGVQFAYPVGTATLRLEVEDQLGYRSAPWLLDAGE